MSPVRKEIVDRVAALVGLVMAIPVMALNALVIKLRHPSLPLLFVETVVGKDAVPFRFYKFRTMLPHPIDYDDRPEILPGNPFVTRVGCWLRRFKLDELPQLLHVLFGQMSIVGPAPCTAPPGRLAGCRTILLRSDYSIPRLRWTPS